MFEKYMLDKPHKKLDVWKKSVVLVRKIYEITIHFPKTEIYGLTTQMRRAAVSIPANISEGAARQTKREFIQFLHMAQGSLSELDTLLEISKELEYLEINDDENFLSLMNDIDKMLTGLIKSLKN